MGFRGGGSNWLSPPAYSRFSSTPAEIGLKALSDQVWIRYPCFCFEKLIVFICMFLWKCTLCISWFRNNEEMIKIKYFLSNIYLNTYYNQQITQIGQPRWSLFYFVNFIFYYSWSVRRCPSNRKRIFERKKSIFGTITFFLTEIEFRYPWVSFK